MRRISLLLLTLLAYPATANEPVPLSPSLSSLRDGCDRKQPNDCYLLGQRYGVGAGVPQDHAHAARLFREACELGARRGCLGLAAAHIAQDGIASPSLVRAASLLRHTCDAGLGEACFLLANLHALSKDEANAPLELRQDASDVDSLTARACDLGYGEACLALLESGPKADSGLQPADGSAAFGVSRGTAALSKQCDEGRAVSCLELGSLYSVGRAAAPLPPLARQAKARGRELLERACTAGDLGELGCVGLGEMYLENRGDFDDPARAEMPFARACAAAYVQGCWGLVHLSLLYQKGEGVPKDMEKAAALARASCVTPQPCPVTDIRRRLLDALVLEPPLEDPKPAQPLRP